MEKKAEAAAGKPGTVNSADKQTKIFLHLLKVLWIHAQIEKGWTVKKKEEGTYEFYKTEEESFCYSS